MHLVDAASLGGRLEVPGDLRDLGNKGPGLPAQTFAILLVALAGPLPVPLVGAVVGTRVLAFLQRHLAEEIEHACGGSGEDARTPFAENLPRGPVARTPYLVVAQANRHINRHGGERRMMRHHGLERARRVVVGVLCLAIADRDAALKLPRLRVLVHRYPAALAPVDAGDPGHVRPPLFRLLRNQGQPILSSPRHTRTTAPVRPSAPGLRGQTPWTLAGPRKTKRFAAR